MSGSLTEPTDLLLLLADDVHGHEDVERVVDPPPDVLLVVLLVRRRRAPRVGQLGDQLVGDLVVRGRALGLDLLAHLEIESVSVSGKHLGKRKNYW